MTVSLDKQQTAQYSQWYPATWQDYEKLRDVESFERAQLFFHDHQLLVENMGWEGINHAKVRELFSMIFYLWFSQFSEQTATLMGGCLLEKKDKQAAAPDLIVYVGEDAPIYQEGERRYIDLNQCRVPDLVGEVSDTTLAIDMREKADIYAKLGIPEYWVIDIKGKRVFAFYRSETGIYLQIETSQILAGLPINLLNQTLEKVSISNVEAAAWFSQQLQQGERQ
ncbi:Uncharacterized protein conserved in cyanobacteria [Gloeomargarita lithophora Alchichica-D10]|uniref:Uncharacterized protein conserved in cyanobacteria n=1 Tax=Gloeomargarita lithophora Alchichica-D10 TaxID=1188229 RepID=A0A1J0AAF8_9CYAN|nr:Uma2 family endonuclease [Gloeomargarita lithophora]APB32928.1 Uncharacterized protein conserved in cyanobacteria [Gloeomargarita lithophora Alchichica-D10]